MTETITRPSGANGETLPGDILVGAQEMAVFLYGESEGTTETSVRRIYHAINRGEIPTFKIGGKIHARKSAILKLIEEQERAAEGRARRAGSDA